MKVFFNEESRRDFRQRYEGCFGWLTLPSSAKRILVRVDAVLPDDGKVVCSDAAGFDYVAYLNSDVEFEFLPIKRGLYYFGKDVVLVERVPQRQWARGINANNTQIKNLSTGKIIPVTFKVLSAVFDCGDEIRPTNKDLEKVNVLLSRKFAVSGIYVMCLGTPIGSVTGKPESPDAPFTFSLFDSLFAQEVKDLIRDFRLNIEVKVA